MFYRIMNKYELINHVFEPALLKECQTEMPSFFMLLFEVEFMNLHSECFSDNKNDTENICRRYAEAEILIKTKSGILNKTEIMARLYCTAYYAYINNHKNAAFFGIFSHDDLAVFKNYFTMFFQTAKMIQLLPAYLFIAFVAPELQKNPKGRYHLLQKEGTSTTVNLSEYRISLNSVEADVLVRNRAVSHVGITFEEWERYKGHIRRYCLEHYVHHQNNSLVSSYIKFAEYPDFSYSVNEHCQKNRTITGVWAT